MPRSLVRLAIALLAAGLSASAAQAQPTYTWVSPVTGVWSDSTRWTPGVPASDPTTVLVYNAAGTETYTATNDLATNPFVLNALQFNNTGTGVITVAGGPLSFAGTTPTVTVSGGSAAITNVLTGTSPLIKSGAGTLTLSGASTYTGGTTVSAGRLVIGGPSVTTATTANGGFLSGTVTSGPVGTGTLALAGGATLANDGQNRQLRNTVNVTGTAANASIVDVAAGELTFAGGFTGGASAAVTKTGAGLLRLTGGSATTASSVGTLTINGGTVQLTDPNNGGGTGNPGGTGDFGATSIIVNNTGTFTFGSGGAFAGEDADLPNATYITANPGGTIVWNNGETFGGVNLAGGAIQLNAGMTLAGTAASTLQSGTVAGPGNLGGTSAVSKTTAGTVTLTGAGITTTGTLNVQDGVLSTNASFTAGTVANTASPTNTLTLGAASTAGTLQYTGASQTNARPVVLTGLGGTIDVTSAATTLTFTGTPIVAVPTANPPISAQPAVSLAGSGPLTKTGAGTLAFTAALNQTGLVTVAGGAVRVNPVTSAGGFAVGSAGALAVNSGAAAATFTLPTLAFAGTGSTLRFDLNAAALPTVPLVNVSAADGLTLGTGGATLAVTNLQALPNGTFTLLDYAGTPITSGFTVTLPGRTQGNLVYDTANTRIDVAVTGSDTIRWTGATNANWDVGTAPDVGGTQNWALASTGAPTNFINTDTVRFDDTSAVRTVNITTAVQPQAVTVDTANTYRFEGAGGITGTTGLVKDGAGTLVLASNNTYTGPTTVTAGTLNFDNAADTTFNSGITGGTTITKTGAGVLSLTGESQGFTGTLTVNAGSVVLAGTGDLNATSIVVNSGATFQFGTVGDANFPDSTFVTVNAGGTLQQTVGEQYGGVNLFGGTISLTGGVTAVNASEVRAGTITGPAAIGGAGSFTKTTVGTVTITGAPINTTGAITIEDGVFSTDAAFGTVAAAAGSPTGALSFTGDGLGVLRYRGTAANVVPAARAVSLGEGGGTFDVTQAAAVFTLAGQVSGNGPLNKLGAGTLVLGGENAASSSFVVGGGTLVVNGQPSTTPGLGAGSVSVASGAVLAGVGRVGGAVTVASGGAVQGGNPTTTAVGTLFASANVSVAGGGAVRARLAAPGSADALSLSAGATLALANSSRLDLRTLTGFGAAGTYTLATVADGATNITVGGATVADGAQLGRYVQGGAATGPVVIDVANFGAALGAGDTLTLNRAGNSLVLTFAPVPEPATVLAVAAAGLGIVGAARRRLRK